ncbi:hypothetical protein ACFL01_03070 [Planctomycetota bacterium]
MNSTYVPANHHTVIASLLIGFATKYVSTFCHEALGHGLMVLLCGGEVVDLYMSLWWPISLSFILFRFVPASIVKQALSFGAGPAICLVCSLIAIVCAKRLLKNRRRWPALFFSWLSLWTFMSVDGYLIFGGLARVGDVGFFIEKLGVPFYLFVVAGVLLLVFYVMTFEAVFLDTATLLFPSKPAGYAVVACFVLPFALLMLVCLPFGLYDERSTDRFWTVILHS